MTSGMNHIGARIEFERTAPIIGAAIEVHRRLGPGFLEGVYEEAMRIELAKRAIHTERQVLIPIMYDECQVGASRIDLLVEGDIVVELKHVEAVTAVHLAQLRSYLSAGAFQVGLLINFDVAVLKDGIRRMLGSG